MAEEGPYDGVQPSLFECPPYVCNEGSVPAAPHLFGRALQPETPAAFRRCANVIATGPTETIHTRTKTTSLLAGKRSGTSQGAGDCIMALIDNRASEVGVALCQLSSLTIIITQYGDSMAFAKTLSFVFSRNPVEVLVPETVVEGKFVQTLLRHFHEVTFTGVQRRTFDEARGAHRLLELMSTDEACLEVSNTDRYLCVAAANALIEFLEMTYNYTFLPHTLRVLYLALESYMEVSRLSARALNLIATGSQLKSHYSNGGGGHQNTAARGNDGVASRGKKRLSKKTFFRGLLDNQNCSPLLPLVDALNHTVTGVGKRMLRSTILQPLRDIESIEMRYDSVEWLRNNDEALVVLRRSLRAFGGDNFERVISSFSHEPKVQTIKTMQQRIEAVMTLWQLLGAAIQVTTELRRFLSGNSEGVNKTEEKGILDNVEQSENCNWDNNNRSISSRSSSIMSLNVSIENDNENNCEGRYSTVSFSDKQRSWYKKKRFENDGTRGRRFPARSDDADFDSCGSSEISADKTHQGSTTLLCKLLETLTVCCMEEICAEIGLYLDESVVRATTKYRTAHTSSFSYATTAMAQRVRRPSSAALQLQHCFAVRPNLSGTLDAARYQYSQAVEAMFTLADELKQRFGVGSLRVACDGVRGYHFVYDARHECNAPDAVFLQKYSGGSHYSLYHSSCMMTDVLQDGEGGAYVCGSAGEDWSATAFAGENVRRVSSEYSSIGASCQMPTQQSFPLFSNNGVTMAASEALSSKHDLTKHQVRGRWVTCTTKELLVLRRNAEDAVAEILCTQDGLVRFLVDYLRQRLGKLQAVCEAVAMLDLLLAFATYSRLKGCVRPTLLRPDKLLGNSCGTYFEEAWHPGGTATANTIRWDNGANVLLVTGPNAAGKTTLLRQVGQLMALAQSGCLVPAKAVALQPCDRLIAHMLCDDLEDATISSFAKEMRELSYLCMHATRESMVLVDELGRRTAVREGTAIAWATVEFLVETRCRAIFVTHFSRLTRLEGSSNGGVKNYHLAVGTESGAEDSATTDAVKMVKTTGKATCNLRFEYKLLPGPSLVDHYGLRLAERVGFFAPALKLAKELMPLMVTGGVVNKMPCYVKSSVSGDVVFSDENKICEGKQIIPTFVPDSNNNNNNDDGCRCGVNDIIAFSDGGGDIRNSGRAGNDNDDKKDSSIEPPARFSAITGVSSINIVTDESYCRDTLGDFSLTL